MDRRSRCGNRSNLAQECSAASIGAARQRAGVCRAVIRSVRGFHRAPRFAESDVGSLATFRCRADGMDQAAGVLFRNDPVGGFPIAGIFDRERRLSVCRSLLRRVGSVAVSCFAGNQFCHFLHTVAALFASMFKYVPAAKISWKDVAIGAVGTALLFSLGKLLLGLYLGRASVGSTYGAAGSLVAAVVWIYYSAQIFFFGAEFTRVYSDWRKLKTQPPLREPPLEASHQARAGN
jgi:hypothetical protein